MSHCDPLNSFENITKWMRWWQENTNILHQLIVFEGSLTPNKMNWECPSITLTTTSLIAKVSATSLELIYVPHPSFQSISLILSHHGRMWEWQLEGIRIFGYPLQSQESCNSVTLIGLLQLYGEPRFKSSPPYCCNCQIIKYIYIYILQIFHRIFFLIQLV